MFEIDFDRHMNKKNEKLITLTNPLVIIELIEKGRKFETTIDTKLKI